MSRHLVALLLIALPVVAAPVPKSLKEKATGLDGLWEVVWTELGGEVRLGAGSLTVLGNGSYAGTITGAGRLVQDYTPGNAGLTLSAAQSFTGGATVNHGILTFSVQAPQHAGTTLNGGVWKALNGSTVVCATN